MADFSDTAHWRDSARPARFFMVDSRAAFPLLFFLMHIRIWTFALALMTVIFFGVIEHYGFSVPVFGRWLRAFIAGPRKVAIPWWKT